MVRRKDSHISRAIEQTSLPCMACMCDILSLQMYLFRFQAQQSSTSAKRKIMVDLIPNPKVSEGELDAAAHHSRPFFVTIVATVKS